MRGPVLKHKTIQLSNCNWRYIPFYLPTENSAFEAKFKKYKEIKEILEKPKELIPEAIKEFIKNKNVGEIRTIFEDVYSSGTHNHYSMTLLSILNCHNQCQKFCRKLFNSERPNPKYCAVNCLYMGDYEAKNSFGALKDYYDEYWKQIGIIQVPHHGSENNLNKELYCNPNKVAIISAGDDDKYKHPDESVLNTIQVSGSIPIIVTEREKTKQIFTFQFTVDTN